MPFAGHYKVHISIAKSTFPVPYPYHRIYKWSYFSGDTWNFCLYLLVGNELIHLSVFVVSELPKT